MDQIHVLSKLINFFKILFRAVGLPIAHTGRPIFLEFFRAGPKKVRNNMGSKNKAWP